MKKNIQKISEMDINSVILVDGKELLIKFLKYYAQYKNIDWDSLYYCEGKLFVLRDEK